MYLGIFSNVVDGASPEEVAEKTARYGLRAVQYIPAASGIGFGFDKPSLGDDFPRWAAAYRQVGVEIAAVGGYMNLLHPNPEKRRRNIETFKDFLRRMRPELGTRLISTETGTYATSGDWNNDPRNRTPEAWDDLRRVTDDLVRVAEQEDVVILYEPYIVNVGYTPDLAVRIVHEVGSPHLRLLMDPTNWFEPDMLGRVTETIERGFATERGLFLLAHAKDVTPPAPGSDKPGLPAAGQGVLDYATYVRLLHEHDYTGPLIIEHLTEAQIPDTMRYVQRFLEAS
jgi:sugar phosphate isomerase/epimerase